MIDSLFLPKTKSNLKFWFLFHCILGIVSTFSAFFLIVWFYLVILLGISKIITSATKELKIINTTKLLFYLAPFEMVSRMVKTTPIIPYEMGKYITFILLLIGIAINPKQKIIGFLLLILLLPGIYIGWTDDAKYQHMVFNVMGLINFSMGVVFFGGMFLYRKKVELPDILRLMIYALLVSLVYVFIVTPKYDEIKFDLSANTDTAGGFGSNQVATAFGLGLFLVFYLRINSINFTGFSKSMDLVLALTFLFQGLMTFSRGGIIGGVLGVLMLYIGHLIMRSQKRNVFLRTWRGIFVYLIPLFLIILVVANNITDGQLLLRYQGESAGTLAGTKEKSLNTLTSGRFDIFNGDIAIFLNNPIWGVGVNQSKYIRETHEGVVAHVEMSRLLAEHGTFGLVILVYLFSIFFTKFNLLKLESSVLFILFVIGFYTTFHAATRTFISPLLMSVVFIPVGSINSRFKK